MTYGSDIVLKRLPVPYRMFEVANFFLGVLLFAISLYGISQSFVTLKAEQ